MKKGLQLQILGLMYQLACVECEYCQISLPNYADGGHVYHVGGDADRVRCEAEEIYNADFVGGLIKSMEV